jgi:D-aminoacyl-tRNA deacylase
VWSGDSSIGDDLRDYFYSSWIRGSGLLFSIIEIGRPDPLPVGYDSTVKCVIQRVTSARVTVAGEVVGEIGRGLLILAGVEKTDGEAEMLAAARKIATLRIFSDEQGKMNRDVRESGGAILAVSQFTLAGSIERGRRPGFDNAAEPDRARELFDRFVAELRAQEIEVATGRFRASMQVELINDGPVTFVL